MALVLDTEANVVLTAGLVKEILNALIGRESFAIQLQDPGTYWIRFGGAAAKNAGLRLTGGRIYHSWELLPGRLGAGTTSSYEGAVSVFWEGGYNIVAGQRVPNITTNLRVIETSS